MASVCYVDISLYVFKKRREKEEIKNNNKRKQHQKTPAVLFYC